MNQIEEFNPPPNPAKITDTRAKSYIEKFGDESWELDALEPRVITELISKTITEYANEEIMEEVRDRVEKEKQVMNLICDDWNNLYSLYSNR